MRRDLPLRRPGMQVRRQPIRRATPRLSSAQIYALVLMFLCVVTVISLGDSPAFEARHLEVHGARFTGEQAVSRIVGMDGSPNLFRLRTDRVAGALAKQPAIESVRVDVRLPDTVVVTVVEREPRLIWVIGDRRYVVDDSGLLFGQLDTMGNPVYPPPGSSAPRSGPSATGSGARASTSPTAPDGSASADTSDAKVTDPPDGRVAQAAKITPKPTPKATPKPTPKAGPSTMATTGPSPIASQAPAPSLLSVPTADPAETAGPQAVTLPVVYDRRAGDAQLTLGDAIDPIALDAGYRLTSVTPANVGSLAPALGVVLDDQFGFTLNSGPNGWVAQFGFYTETLRKDTVIPTQVRDLRELLLNYGEKHVAWVWLVADIADNHIDTYLAK